MAKHGMSKSKLFGIWHGMCQRCNNPNNNSYKDYGERGIKVCDEWLDSKSFFEWAKANGYEEGLTIDRIDVDGNYEPKNCRWVDWSIQANNTRRNHYLTINGETKTVAQWAKQNNIPYHHVFRRTEMGWSIEDAVTKPIRENITATYKGETKTLIEWAEVLGKDVKALYARKSRGMSDEEIIGKPFRGSKNERRICTY